MYVPCVPRVLHVDGYRKIVLIPFGGRKSLQPLTDATIPSALLIGYYELINQTEFH